MRLVNLDDLVLMGPGPNRSGRWQANGSRLARLGWRQTARSSTHLRVAQS